MNGPKIRRAATLLPRRGCVATALLLCFIPIVSSSLASPESSTSGVFYQQRPGEKVSADLMFTDEQGREEKLESYFGRRPVVLLMGYYGCPMLCGVSLNAVTRTLEDFPPDSTARDFEFLFVSIDPKESFAVAAEKKKEALRKLGWKPAETRWHFLSGGPSAAALADAVGFHFRYDFQSRQYVHPSGLVFLSSSGIITSYLPGIDYPATEFESALKSARQGQTGTIQKGISILCFSNDQPVGSPGYYVLWALRFGALVTLCGLILIIRIKPSSVGKRSLLR